MKAADPLHPVGLKRVRPTKGREHGRGLVRQKGCGVLVAGRGAKCRARVLRLETVRLILVGLLNELSFSYLLDRYKKLISSRSS